MTKPNDLNRKLNVYGLTMIAIGACIGSGIFITPAETLKVIPHYGYALIPWILGGVATFFGALTFSELGSRFPKTGGVYVYLKEAYGPLVGFLYGWIILLIVNTGALAALGIGFAEYLDYLIPMGSSGKQAVSVLTITMLSLVNSFGVGVSQNLINLFTGLKLAAIFLIICLAAYFLFNDPSHVTEGVTRSKPSQIWEGILIAFVGVFWSFGGWHHATYLSGETINPQKTVPKAMLIGTLTVTITYLIVIFAYMGLAPYDILAQSDRIAGDAMGYVIAGGGKLVTIIISVSFFGTIAIYTMSAPRIYHAMAKDKVFFKAMASVHPKFKTPHIAIGVQACWAIILILIWGSFNKLITFVTFMDIGFMALTTFSIFIFRKRSKERPPFELKLYPYVPIVFLIITVSFFVYTLLSMNSAALGGVGILLIGIPVYYYFRRTLN